MSRPISTLPGGFLAALGMKNNGENPADLIDAVAPVMEMHDFYMNAQQSITVADAQLLPTFLGVVIPVVAMQTSDDEYAFVRSLTCYISAPDSPAIMDFIQFQPAMQMQQGGVAVGPQQAQYWQPSAGAFRRQAATWENFWMPPGAVLGAWVSENSLTLAGAAIHCTAQWWKIRR